MYKLIRNIRADFMKLRRGKILLLHILLAVPVMIGTMFLIGRNGQKPLTNLIAFIEIFGLGAPFAIGVVTNGVMKIEEAAGGYKGILKNENGRCIGILSKLIILVFTGGMTFALVLGSFFIIEKLIYDVTFGLSIYTGILLVFFVGITVQYVLSIIVTMKLGQIGGVIWGGFGSLVGALMITQLGKNIWMYIPFAWIPRIQNEIFMKHYVSGKAYSEVNLRGEYFIIALISLVIFTFLFLWIKRWEGNRTID